jgi:hypothetical protein
MDWSLEVLYQDAGTAAPVPARISIRWPSSSAKAVAEVKGTIDGITAVHAAAMTKCAISCFIFQQSSAIAAAYHFATRTEVIGVAVA